MEYFLSLINIAKAYAQKTNIFPLEKQGDKKLT